MLQEDDVFSGLVSAPLPESVNMGPWKQPVLRAIEEFKRISGRDDAFKLYIPLAKQFNSSITNDAVERIFKQAKDRGFDVFLEPLVKSVMRALAGIAISECAASGFAEAHFVFRHSVCVCCVQQ